MAGAIFYVLPYLDGIKVPHDLPNMLIISILFNIFFAALEWLLDVVVIGINISTLSIGILFSRFISFATLLLAPAVAFYGCAKFLPRYCQVDNFYPSSVIAGLTIGSILFAELLAERKK